MGAVPDAGGEAVVALGEDSLGFLVTHVVHFRFVAAAPLEGEPLALAHAGESHPPAHPARSFRRDDDGVVHRSGTHDARCVVAETFR